MNDDIYRYIKNRILFLEYEPGQILNEKVLTKEFGVSRTPLREVLRRLEWDGLVRVLPRSGTMVSEIEFPKMMHTYQIRFEIEDLLGRLSTLHATPEHLSKMEELAESCGRMYEEKQIKELVQVDVSFRGLLFEAANNPVLRDISNHLYHLTLRLWVSTLSRGNWTEEVRAMHEEILQTIVAWKDRNSNQTGATRRNALVGHFERIREKYFGMSATMALPSLNHG